MSDDVDERLLKALERVRALAFRPDEETDEGFAKTRTEERIDLIVGLMVAGSYTPGLTHRKLAEEWRLSVRRIEALVDEAARVVRRYVRDDVEGRKLTAARIVQSIERIAQKAEQRGTKNGYRDALAAYAKLADIHGLVRQQVEIEDKTASRFEGWTREEKEHFAKTGERPLRAVLPSRHE